MLRPTPLHEKKKKNDSSTDSQIHISGTGTSSARPPNDAGRERKKGRGNKEEGWRDESTRDEF